MTNRLPTPRRVDFSLCNRGELLRSGVVWGALFEWTTSLLEAKCFEDLPGEW